MKNVYITSACRTATGTLGKTLKNISAVELGSSVISNALSRSKLKKNEVDEIILGLSSRRSREYVFGSPRSLFKRRKKTW